MTMRRVPQPPLDPALRDSERHDFWPGFIAALVGIILLFCGAVYALTIVGLHLPILAPLGGTLLMLGWALLGVSALRPG